MKLETPILRATKRWQPELEHHHVELEKNLGETSFFPMNSEALEKALSHLIQNSLEAMSRKLNKQISIQLKDEGDYLLLSFEDNGVGIESHHLNLIGDAFFTTKAQSQHLGLGLTEAFGIFKQHHAIVTVTSEIGKFTRFEIRFDKNEALKLIQKQETGKMRTFEEEVITIPENLPRPSEMTRALHFVEEKVEAAQKANEYTQDQSAVDEEIEKLLELNDIDVVEQAAPSDANIDVAAHADIEIEYARFVDVNPDVSPEDDFQLKETIRRDADV
jgi:anti-sigma regulatory factor (Ser/Thr protein kinase)